MDELAQKYLGITPEMAKRDCSVCYGTGVVFCWQPEGNAPGDGFSYPEVCNCVELPEAAQAPIAYCSTCIAESNDIPF